MKQQIIDNIIRHLADITVEEEVTVPLFKTNLKRTVAMLREHFLPANMSKFVEYSDTSDYYAKKSVTTLLSPETERLLAQYTGPILKKHNVKFGHLFVGIFTSNAHTLSDHLHMSALDDQFNNRSTCISMFISNDQSYCEFGYFDSDVSSDAIANKLADRKNGDSLDKYMSNRPDCQYKYIDIDDSEIIQFDSRKVIHSAKFKPKNESSIGCWLIFDLGTSDIPQSDLVMKFHETLLG